ncbi:MAG: glutathione S-transferase N-terminal domain-containing protein [Gammaproteobacteria bacterium]
MKLLITPTSPFARKARALLLEKQIPCETAPASPWDDAPEILAANPLRKIPVLLLDGGAAVFDSRVICEYLDAQSGAPRFLPEDANARMAVKTREAMIEGAMDSAAAILMAGKVAPEMQNAAWRKWLSDKIGRTLDALEKDIASRAGGMDMSDIACFCFLDFILFRLPDEDWRPAHPQLEAWFAETAKRESFAKTDPR